MGVVLTAGCTATFALIRRHYNLGRYGNPPLDPTVNQTYEVLEALLRELGDIFPDSLFHLGVCIDTHLSICLSIYVFVCTDIEGGCV